MELDPAVARGRSRRLELGTAPGQLGLEPVSVPCFNYDPTTGGELRRPTSKGRNLPTLILGGRPATGTMHYMRPAILRIVPELVGTDPCARSAPSILVRFSPVMASPPLRTY